MPRICPCIPTSMTISQLTKGDGPYVEVISPHSYPSDSKSISIRIRVSDPDGLHQVILHAIQPDNRSTVKKCRGLEGRNERVIDFDYDGVIPSAHDPAYSRSTSLLSPLVHPILGLMFLILRGMRGEYRYLYLLLSDAPAAVVENLRGSPSTACRIRCYRLPFVVEVMKLR